jgi:competence protein ComEC
VAEADPSARALGALPIAMMALVALRPDPSRPRTELAWLALIALVAALAGLLAGGARLHAIDAGALRARPGTQARVEGFVAAVPRGNGGEVAVRIDSAAGRLLAVAPEPVEELPVGSRVSAEGVLAPPEPWREASLRRQGVAMLLRTERLEPLPGRRGGLAGWIDGIRTRAERSLGRGTPDREAALARGFVLGQDDRIDPATREDFRRSGLAHLLAVSGQNVILLCLLAWPLLAIAGLTLRARLIASLCLIAIYVPVTGAGPSIQRAGVMGAAGLVAALADRPRSRWYAVLLAAAVTLALNPRADGDVGWQLSFAAVIGILLWGRRLAALLAAEAGRGSVRRAVAEGAAVTVAATIATSPLMASAFDQLSPAALPANLLALPAVAPAMWLGMLTGIAGQLPVIPVEPLNWLDSLCLAYIAQVAHWLAESDWAALTVHLDSIWATVASYVGLVIAMEGLLRWLERWRGMAGLDGRRTSMGVGAAAAVLALVVGLLAGWPSGSKPAPAPSGLVARVLDVGQGDSILLDPPGSDPVLIDTGPPGDGAEDRLRELGVERLSAIVITHNQSDHSGALDGLLGSVAVDRLIFAADAPRLRGAAVAVGARPLRLAQGISLDFGTLHLTALWPPRELLAAAEDPNQRSLVLVARWRHFSMLLTGDAEAESVPMDPGPIDVLKVSHHGSEDAGLEGLLERSLPRLAVVSVGDGNPHGHPAGETLSELSSHRITTMRTDRDGEIEIRANGSSWAARAVEG